jgi:hypothetical protein
MNVFLIETPHQLLNAIEAKHALRLMNNNLIVLLLEEYPIEAYASLLSSNEWETIQFVPFMKESKSPITRYLKNHPAERVRGYYATWKIYQLRKRIDRLAASLGSVEKLLLGNYWREHMRHFGHVIRYRDLYLIDDGTATLIINDLRRRELSMANPKVLGRRKLDLINRVIGLRTSMAEKVTYFTTYELETINTDEVIKNDYAFFREKAKTGKPGDEVFFLGMTLYDEGFTDELYLEQLERVKEYFKNDHLIYLPHKGEPAYRVDRVQKELGLEIRRFDVPIEYQLCVRGTVPKILASFFSSALENCRIIFGSHLHIKAVYLNPELFPLRSDFVRNVYEYFQSKASPKFEIVRL